MSVDGLLLCRSQAAVTDARQLFTLRADDSIEFEGRRTWHYSAVTSSNKSLEPHICLCECSVRGETLADNSDPLDLGYVSDHDAEAAQPRLGRSDEVPNQEIGHQSSSTPEEIQDSEAMPQQNGRKRLVDFYRGDDVDGTDFKNMPDYDPD